MSDDPGPTPRHGGVRDAGEPAMFTSHRTPNLSTSMPKVSPQGAFSSGAVIVAPSASPSQKPRSSASSSEPPDSEMEPLVFGVHSMCDGTSEHMSSRIGVSSWLCMIRSCSAASTGIPASLKELMVSSPPKTDW